MFDATAAAEITRLRARIDDLLTANNRYLQRARDAEAARIEAIHIALRAAIPLEQLVINDELDDLDHELQVNVLKGLAAVRGLILEKVNLEDL